MNDMQIAKSIFERDAPTFVLVKDGVEMARGNAQGIRELLGALIALGEVVRGGALADKVTGKAVAMSAAQFGIRSIYTPLASERALPVCAAYNIELVAERVIPLILNVRGDGPCPLERTVGPLDKPSDGVRALVGFVHLSIP